MTRDTAEAVRRILAPLANAVSIVVEEKAGGGHAASLGMPGDGAGHSLAVHCWGENSARVSFIADQATAERLMCAYAEPERPLRAFLDLSTAHLTPETRARLDGTHASAWPCAGGRTRDGFFVRAHELHNDGIPDDLWECMAKARELGAEYILFDRDAAPSDILPVYGDGSEEIHPGWTVDDAAAAELEGWNIFRASSDGGLYIAVSDDAESRQFDSAGEPNVAAHVHVEARAAAGSPVHKRALAAVAAGGGRKFAIGQRVNVSGYADVFEVDTSYPDEQGDGYLYDLESERGSLEGVPESRLSPADEVEG